RSMKAGAAALERKDLAEAERQFGRALALGRPLELFMETGVRALTRAQLARVMIAGHRFAEASELLEGARRVFERQKKPDLVAATLLLGASAHEARGDLEAAATDVRRALAVLEKRFGTESAKLVPF